MQPQKVIKEFTVYITPDGEEYELHVPSGLGRWLLSQSGWGTPPIDYITQRGPFQHGSTVRDFFLRPRVIQMLVRQQFCDRDDLWAGRARLLDAVRPNRQTVATATTPGTLRRLLSDGSLRDLSVFITQGPRFEPRVLGRWDEFAFEEVLRFVAHDPVVFDPDRVDTTIGKTDTLNELPFPIVFPGVFGTAADLTYPITFPITFGADNIDDTINLTYSGTWETFPIIVVTGPLDNFKLVNNTTGEKIAVTFDIPAGDSLTIDLSYGAKTIVDAAGVNRIGTLTSDSDLATWHLAPNPEAPDGVNNLTMTGQNQIPGTSKAVIQAFTRYFGI